MCEESIIGTNLSRKAILLIAEVLHMGNKVLSLSAAAKVQVGTSLPCIALSTPLNYLLSSYRWFLVYSPWQPITTTANIGSLALRPFRRSIVSIGTDPSWNLRRMRKILDRGERTGPEFSPGLTNRPVPRANSEDAVRRGQRQVEQVKIKMGMQMDGEAFRASLLETQVCRLCVSPT